MSKKQALLFKRTQIKLIVFIFRRASSRLKKTRKKFDNQFIVSFTVF